MLLPPIYILLAFLLSPLPEARLAAHLGREWPPSVMTGESIPGSYNTLFLSCVNNFKHYQHES
jgi:hypothetical protein